MLDTSSECCFYFQLKFETVTKKISLHKCFHRFSEVYLFFAEYQNWDDNFVIKVFVKLSG